MGRTAVAVQQISRKRAAHFLVVSFSVFFHCTLKLSWWPPSPVTEESGVQGGGTPVLHHRNGSCIDLEQQQRVRKASVFMPRTVEIICFSALMAQFSFFLFSFFEHERNRAGALPPTNSKRAENSRIRNRCIFSCGIADEWTTALKYLSAEPANCKFSRRSTSRQQSKLLKERSRNRHTREDWKRKCERRIKTVSDPWLDLNHLVHWTFTMLERN